MSKPQCPSIHKWSDQQCIRTEGHDGVCMAKSIRSRTDGTISRAEWWSENGKFKSHHQYDTKYPMNAATEKP